MVSHTTDEIPFNKDGVKDRLSRLGKIYKMINEIPEDTPNPIHLARKITLYNTAEGIIGELYAQSVYDHGIAYNNRKEQQGIAEMAFIGTGKEKEAYAEQQISNLRREETKAEAEMKRWEKAYNSTEMLANAIKHELGVIMDDLRAGGRT